MLINLRAFLKYYRMKDWRAYFGLVVLGFILAQGFLSPRLEILLFLLICVLLLAFGFSVNNFFDIKEDREKVAEHSFISRSQFAQVGEVKNFLIQNKKNFFLSVSPGLLALLLSAYFGKEVFLFVLVAALIGFFYSAPPLRMKSRPFLDLISHGLFAGALILLFPFLVFNSKLTLFHCLVASSVFYLSVMLETRNHLEDYGSDSRAGLQTTVCFLGYKNAENFLKYLAFFYPLALFPAFFTLSQNFRFLFLILTCLFLPLFLFRKSFKIIDTYYGILSYFAIAASTLYPW